MKATILTKEQVNEIHTYTVNDNVFRSAYNEALLLDLEGKIGKSYLAELEDDNPDTALSETLSNALAGGLRTALAYYVIGRSIRIANTITISRYGVNTKTSDYSNLPDQKQIAESSNYLKQIGDRYLAKV